MRLVDQGAYAITSLAKAPSFKVEGARNVRLETIKRAEDDDFTKGANATIVLRLFEELGGHARVQLHMWGPLLHV